MAVNKTVSAGVAIAVAAVLAIVGGQIMTAHNYDTTFSVTGETDFNDYAESTNGLSVADGVVQLNSTVTTGNYQSIALDMNESNVTRVEVVADISEPENSSATFVVNAATPQEKTFALNDGLNTYEFSESEVVGTFGLALERDDVNVTSPSVSSVTGMYETGGGILTTVGMAGFGLLLLLVAVKEFELGRLGGRQYN